MGSLIGWLILKGVSPRFARPLAYAGLILLIGGVLFLTVKIHDRGVIDKHEARQEAEVAKADRKADQKAAEQRMDDVARQNAEAQQIKEATDEARNNGRDPRAAYYECVRLQQAARRQHQPPAEC